MGSALRRLLAPALTATALLIAGDAADVAAQTTPAPNDSSPSSVGAAAGAATPSQEAAPQAAARQQPRRDAGVLRITVIDESGAAIVDTPVRIANDTGVDLTAQTNDRGQATFENLVPGKYAVHVESLGFDAADFEQTVRRGNTNKEVTLKIAAFVEQVDVTRDDTEKALNDSFSSTLSTEQIEALPDDADEMATVLEQMAGPGARIRVNGFQGGRLPPKSQIAEIRFRFDPYSAENHDAGSPRVDIRTRPGQGDWRNSMTMTFRDDSLNARNAFAGEQLNEASQRGMWTLDGPVKKGKSSFSIALGGLNSFDTETIRSLRPNRTGNTVIEQPNDRLNLEARVEHALNKNHILRVELQDTGNKQQNLGVGNYAEEERAYTQQRDQTTFRISESGSIKGRYRNEIRVEYETEQTALSSFSDALAVNVLDAFNIGGAQRLGGTRTRTLEIADDFDFTLGKKHAFRTGIEMDRSWLRADERTNFTGTYTFSSLADYEAGRPGQFRQRTGEPLVEYANTEFGWYINDDMRLRKNVMLSAGLRYEAQSLMPDRNNFAPRLHVTWSPFKSAKTTLRAGGGVFYDWYDTGLYEDTLRVNGVNQQDIIIDDPCYPDAFAPGCSLPAASLPPSIVRASPVLVMPYVTRFSLGVEHQVTSWFGLRGNFYRQSGYNQFRSLNVNAPLDGGARPQPEFDNVSQFETIGHGRNYGVEISGNFNYAPRRMFAFIHYRYGRAENDGDGSRLPADSNNLAAEWGPSSGDVRHRVNFSVNSPIAFGFRANTFVRYESAPPYTVTTGSDGNLDGVFYNDRPDGISRNSARGDDAIVMDLRLSWNRGFGPPRTPTGPGGGPNIRMQGPGPGGGGGGRGGGGGGGGPMMMMGGGPGGEQKRFSLELFSQVNNLLNTVNYTGFSGVQTSPLFGRPSAAQAPRRIELGMRLGF